MKSKVIIIAEAGVNHNGNMELAKKLVDVACEAEVDYVKFQSFKADKLVSKQAKLANYQKDALPDSVDSQYELLKSLELSKENHYELIDYCREKGIKFFSTAFDLDSIELLAELEMDMFKIPSGEITNLPYLEKIARYGKKTILSTGMSTMEDVADAISVLTKNGLPKEQIILLHCTTEYPAPYDEVNLKAMESLRAKFGVEVGYSDHTKGIEVAVAAVATGATVIEKHFTLNKELEGPDHKASLEPFELVQMVKSIRNVEQALGTGVKEPTPSELNNIVIARKSIHLAHEVSAGLILEVSDLEMKRPGNGISPMMLHSILGKKVKGQFEAGHQLSLDDIIE
jgi:N-acetylneuraminate synthase